MSITILENSLDFILDAVEKISGANEKEEIEKQRLIKYSLLHLSAGIELLFKYRLMQKDYRYIFSKIDAATEEDFKSGNFISIDSKEAIKRLNRFCDITLSEAEKAELTAFRNKRNKAEHFILTETTTAIEEITHKALSFIVQFIVNYCPLEAFTEQEKILFEKIKECLGELHQHHKDVLKIAQQELDNLGDNIPVLTCPDCGQEFLTLIDKPKCMFCNYTASGEHAATNYIENILNISAYETVKHGGEFPQYSCPECGDYSMVYDETHEKVVCLSCGFEDDISNYGFCDECGTLYRTSEDYDLGICPGCIRYKWEKE